jgi:micrococcal nuclease
VLCLAIALLMAACAGGGVAADEPEPARSGNLTITSPQGRAVLERDWLWVRGTAPVGAEIVRDIGFAPDDRSTANARGTWAMRVELDEGANELTFRIGDDDETEVSLVVVYEPRSARAEAARTTSARPSRTAKPSRTPRPSPVPTARPTPMPTPALGAAPTGRTELATVASVTDGDTIRVLLGGQNVPVRYIGIDTPETHNGVEWMGAEASAANAALVEGQQVVLEKDVSETDQYGRLLRYVWLDTDAGWLLVNLELLRHGYAQVSTYPPDVKYTDGLFLPAQQAAREAGLGLWGGAPPTPAPTPVPTPAPIVPLIPQPPSNCEPSYPDFCLPIGSADLDCGEVQWRRFTVRWDVPNPDPHRFDGDGDGVGCES